MNDSGEPAQPGYARKLANLLRDVRPVAYLLPLTQPPTPSF